MAIETKSRNLDLDQDFSMVETKILKVSRFFSTVEIGSLPVSRLRVSNCGSQGKNRGLVIKQSTLESGLIKKLFF